MTLAIQELKDENAQLKRDLEMAIALIKALVKYREFVLFSCSCDSRDRTDKHLLIVNDVYEQLAKDCRFLRKENRQEEKAENGNDERSDSEKESEMDGNEGEDLDLENSMTSEDSEYEKESSEDESESIQETTKNKTKRRSRVAKTNEDGRKRVQIDWMSYKNDKHEEVETESGKRIKCLECQRIVSNLKQFKAHYKTTHDLSAGSYKGKYRDFVDSSGQKRFRCLKCDKVVNTYYSVKNHYRLAHVLGRGEKSKSNLNFNNVKELRDKNSRASEDSEYEEDSSEDESEENESTQETTKNKTKRRSRVAKTSEDGRKRVQIDWMSYKNDKHEEVETKSGKRIKCLECQRIVSNFKQFKAHYKTTHDLSAGSYKGKYKDFVDSTGQKRFQCLKCDKVVNTYDSVKNHYRLAHVLGREGKLKSNLNFDNGKELKEDKNAKTNEDSRDYQELSDGNEIEDSELIEKATKNKNKRAKVKIKYQDFVDSSGEKRFQCLECSKVFPTYISVKNHYRNAHILPPFVCPADGCGRTFKSKNCMTWHHDHVHLNLKTKRIRPKGRFMCEWPGCEKILNSRDNLTKHMKYHVTETKYNCEWPGCEYQTKYKGSLVLHAKRHAGEPKFGCHWPGCTRTFYNESLVRVHVSRSHLGEKKCKCDWPGCDFRAASKTMIKNHMSKHTKERKFACNQPGCGKKYLTQPALDYHMVIHKGIRPFKCAVNNCGKDFVYASSLRKHVQQVHEKTK